MRDRPPHSLVRYRHGVLAVSLLAWLVAAVVLWAFKGRTDLPVTPIVCVSALIFTWGNGAYWWVMLKYPYIQIPPGDVYVSRDELSGRNSTVFFIGYGVAAVLMSIACINVWRGELG